MTTVECILPRTILGEGPHWDHTEQALYFVDIKASEVHRYTPATKKETVVKIEGGPVSIVIPVQGQKNKYVITIGRDIAIMTWDGVSSSPSHVERVATVDEVDGKRENRLNDGKADPTGRLWAGTLGAEHGPVDFTPHNGSLFSLSKDRKVTSHVTGVTCSNGLAWSLDNKIMYYIDSLTLKVEAFDFNAEKGQAINRRTAFDFKANGVKGFPDGMTIDTQGNLWVACFDGSQVINVDPRTGKLLKTISIPSPKVTSVVFGGKNLDELYVTSASVDLNKEELAATPSAGCTFRILGTGAKGFPGQSVVL
ncbi:regucalcin [Anabrus simplex]|uniref:regucalcin n=1 Tax=Anabrus simplex TaxID=316456 RepID=UPI0035A2A187